jgi:hypothetical protein
MFDSGNDGHDVNGDVQRVQTRSYVVAQYTTETGERRGEFAKKSTKSLVSGHSPASCR